MPIYDMSGAQRTLPQSAGTQFLEQETGPIGGRNWISAFLARSFFFALLLFDLCWGCYSFLLMVLASFGAMLSFGRIPLFLKIQSKSWLSIKRAMVCALALLVALFTPPFGIMIACTYFLMYDKNGIKEIVPESLQAQFSEFFPQS